MRYLVIKSTLQIIGQGWMNQSITQERELQPYELENLRDDKGNFCRENVDRWLRIHAGDFAHITDWRAELEDGDRTIELGWQQDESEEIFYESLYQEDDRDLSFA